MVFKDFFVDFTGFFSKFFWSIWCFLRDFLRIFNDFISGWLIIKKFQYYFSYFKWCFKCSDAICLLRLALYRFKIIQYQVMINFGDWIWQFWRQILAELGRFSTALSTTIGPNTKSVQIGSEWGKRWKFLSLWKWRKWRKCGRIVGQIWVWLRSNWSIYGSLTERFDVSFNYQVGESCVKSSHFYSNFSAFTKQINYNNSNNSNNISQAAS